MEGGGGRRRRSKEEGVERSGSFKSERSRREEALEKHESYRSYKQHAGDRDGSERDSDRDDRPRDQRQPSEGGGRRGSQVLRVFLVSFFLGCSVLDCLSGIDGGGWSARGMPCPGPVDGHSFGRSDGPLDGHLRDRVSCVGHLNTHTGAQQTPPARRLTERGAGGEDGGVAGAQSQRRKPACDRTPVGRCRVEVSLSWLDAAGAAWGCVARERQSVTQSQGEGCASQSGERERGR
eukprot:987289-Rhodomonas_salina.2